MEIRSSEFGIRFCRRNLQVAEFEGNVMFRVLKYRFGTQKIKLKTTIEQRPQSKGCAYTS